MTNEKWSIFEWVDLWKERVLLHEIYLDQKSMRDKQNDETIITQLIQLCIELKLFDLRAMLNNLLNDRKKSTIFEDIQSKKRS